MSESDKADIVERLREYARWAEYLRLRNTLNDAIAEIERLRALPSRDAVLEEAARVAERAHLVPPDGGSPTENERAVAEAAAAAIRALKKDTDNG